MKDYICAIVALVEEYNVTRFAEVGVYQGRTIGEVVENVGEWVNEYWAIDSWEVYDGGLSVSERRWATYHRRVCKLMITVPQLRVLKLPSSVAAKLFPDGYLDMVYVDADHSYNAVVEDINAWMPKIRRGGILGGHDYNLPGVCKAVGELIGESALLSLPDKGITWATVV